MIVCVAMLWICKEKKSYNLKAVELSADLDHCFVSTINTECCCNFSIIAEADGARTHRNIGITVAIHVTVAVGVSWPPCRKVAWVLLSELNDRKIKPAPAHPCSSRVFALHNEIVPSLAKMIV